MYFTCITFCVNKYTRSERCVYYMKRWYWKKTFAYSSVQLLIVLRTTQNSVILDNFVFKLLKLEQTFDLILCVSYLYVYLHICHTTPTCP